MARFCPYCGRQLGERSKFCPKCGKPSPHRRPSTAVIVEDIPASGAKPQADSTGVSEARAKRSIAREPERPKQPSGPLSESGNHRQARAPEINNKPVRTVSSRPAASPPRRYAPPTHAIIETFEQAGFGLRYGAWMFDFLITLIAIMTFTFVVTALSHRSVVGSNRDLVIVAILTVALFVLNFVVFAGRHGQSAGMRILGIRIVRVDGNPFTMKQAALRHLLGYPLSTAAFFLGFLWMLWDPRQQAWHDKLARTMVVMSR